MQRLQQQQQQHLLRQQQHQQQQQHSPSLSGRLGADDGSPQTETLSTAGILSGGNANANDSSHALSSSQMFGGAATANRPYLPFPSVPGSSGSSSSAAAALRQPQHQHQHEGLGLGEHHSGLDVDEMSMTTSSSSQRLPSALGPGSGGGGSVLGVFGGQAGKTRGVGETTTSLGLGPLPGLGLDQGQPLGAFGGQAGGDDVVGEFSSGLPSPSLQHALDPLSGDVLDGLPGLGLEPGQSSQVGAFGRSSPDFGSGLSSVDYRRGGGTAPGMGVLGTGLARLGGGGME
ncbi:unnamed protein product, partial [Laminaria digitata]